MDNEKFILCRNCDAVHHVTSFDNEPVFRLCGSDIEETPANDWRDFMTAHAGHTLEPLKATGAAVFTGSAAEDPMRGGYIEVTSGSRRMLLRRTRNSIQDAVRFAPVNGELSAPVTTVGVQEKAIRKEMERHFSWQGRKFDGERITRFVEVFKNIVEGMDADSVHATEPSDEADDAGYAPLDDWLVEHLSGCCAEAFVDGDIDYLRHFIQAQRSSSGVLALIITSRLSVLPPPRLER